MVDIRIKVTVPNIVINSAAARSLIMSKMQSKTAPDLQRMFRGTVNGWKDKPNFLQKFRNSPSEVSTFVYPGMNTSGGKTYILVNQGAPEHTIRPRGRGMLRFQPGYRAGTRPRVLKSRSAVRSGSYISARMVQHPGFAAREFDDEIAKQYASTFEKDMQDVFGNIARLAN